MSLPPNSALPAPGPVQLAAPGRGWWERALGAWSWEFAVALVALIAAGVAFWITLDAHFLAYPGWLAVQKADFILGPIGVGLYWRHRRPDNRLGLLLIGLGLLGIPYILASTATPLLFGIGVLSEWLMFAMTTAVILAFPSGRLDGLPERVILFVVLVAGTLPGLVFAVTSPRFSPWFSISGCRSECPANGLDIWSPPTWAPQLDKAVQITVIVTALATAGLLVWRFVTGTPPRRRALAIGGPIAFLFLLIQASYRELNLLSAHGLSIAGQPVHGLAQWTFAGARAMVWYGFLFALIAAELFAGRVLRRLVCDSLGRPSLSELEGMLRGPLGDPGLRLGFWRPSTRDWADAEWSPLKPPGPGQALTEVHRDDEQAVGIVHDAQLSEDPELLQAAGAVALLALENTELDAAWRSSLRELADSRDELADSQARLATAADRERRKLERDLHDGAQQRLVAAAINLTLADEAGDERELHDRIAESRAEIEEALIELRELAHGIYPAALARSGLSGAFDWLARRYEGKVVVTEATVGRFSPEIELAVYYCGLEGVQNASKHAGVEAHISIQLHVEADQLHLEVRDDGRGFDVAHSRDSVGMQNMRDRIGAVGGHVDIISEPAKGALVTASVPVRRAPHSTRRSELDVPASIATG